MNNDQLRESLKNITLDYRSPTSCLVPTQASLRACHADMTLVNVFVWSWDMRVDNLVPWAEYQHQKRD